MRKKTNAQLKNEIKDQKRLVIEANTRSAFWAAEVGRLRIELRKLRAERAA